MKIFGANSCHKAADNRHFHIFRQTLARLEAFAKKRTVPPASGKPRISCKAEGDSPVFSNHLLNLIAEAIVVAGGGVIAGDESRGVEKEGPKVVDPAAHPCAVHPPIRATATLR